MKFQLFLLAVLAALAYSKDITVKNSSELQNALDNANPGDVINMKDATYKGSFEAKANGKDGKPITLKGGRGAKITSGNDKYGFHLTGDYWVLDGFTVEKSGKGIVLDGASNNVLNNLNVNHVNDEAVHFRYNSCDNVIQNSEISYTGLGEGRAGYGEGVYIGSAFNHWENNQPDKSNRNKVIKNKFGPGITAESVDIKEGTEGGLVQENVFNGEGMKNENSADSWVDCKGKNYKIIKNTGTSSIAEGFQVNSLFLLNFFLFKKVNF